MGVLEERNVQQVPGDLVLDGFNENFKHVIYVLTIGALEVERLNMVMKRLGDNEICTFIDLR